MTETTATRAPRYTVTDEWLRQHDNALIDQTLAAVNQRLPSIKKRYAQAGADAVVAYLGQRNRIHPRRFADEDQDGRPQ
jgi:hypothetical protein